MALTRICAQYHMQCFNHNTLPERGFNGSRPAFKCACCTQPTHTHPLVVQAAAYLVKDFVQSWVVLHDFVHKVIACGIIQHPHALFCLLHRANVHSRPQQHMLHRCFLFIHVLNVNRCLLFLLRRSCGSQTTDSSSFST